MARKRIRGNGHGSVYLRNGKGSWIAQWHDHQGKRREKSTRTTDKRTAERILAKFVADEALRREGVIDPELDAFAVEGKRPIKDHFNEYAKHLRSRCSVGHAETVVVRIERIIKVGKLATIADLRPPTIERALGEIKGKYNLSPQTRNDYLTAIKAFANWLTKMRRIPHNPITYIERLAVVETEYRRALIPEEAARLIEAAEAGPAQRGLTNTGRGLVTRGQDLPSEHIRWEMSGFERAVLYRLTLETALRRGAIERLKVNDFDLSELPTVTVKPKANTKNSRKLVIPIRAETAKLLTTLFMGKLPAASAFNMPKEYETARMLRTDLAAARKAWIAEGETSEIRAKRAESDFLADVDGDGRVIDFHALRTTCSTWLDQAGVSASLATRITGHRSTDILQKHYHRMNLNQTRRAVESLPVLAATGTDNKSPL